MIPNDNNPDRKNELPKSPPEKSLEEQIAELRVRAQKLLPDQLIPLLPPPEVELQEITTHLTSKGVQVSPTALPDVWVGGFHLVISELKEARVGFFENVPSIAFWYRFTDTKQIKTVVVRLPDSLDPMKTAKLLVVGRIRDLPPPTQVDFLPPNDFFRLGKFTPDTFHDEHCLLSRQKVFEDGIRSRVQALENAKAYAISESNSLRGTAERVPALEQKIEGMCADLKYHSTVFRLILGYAIAITLLIIWRFAR